VAKCSPDGGSLLHYALDKCPGGLFIRAVCYDTSHESQPAVIGDGFNRNRVE
jgi:hypothetical protein